MKYILKSVRVRNSPLTLSHRESNWSFSTSISRTAHMECTSSSFASETPVDSVSSSTSLIWPSMNGILQCNENTPVWFTNAFITSAIIFPFLTKAVDVLTTLLSLIASKNRIAALFLRMKTLKGRWHSVQERRPFSCSIWTEFMRWWPSLKKKTDTDFMPYQPSVPQKKLNTADTSLLSSVVNNTAVIHSPLWYPARSSSRLSRSSGSRVCRVAGTFHRLSGSASIKSAHDNTDRYSNTELQNRDHESQTQKDPRTPLIRPQKWSGCWIWTQQPPHLCQACLKKRKTL